MSYKVFSIPLFDKQAKRLAKKYPSLKTELAVLIEAIRSEPMLGKALGSNFYKIRLAISSKGKGKSGGARVITYLKITQNIVYLVQIYDKAEMAAISDKELEQLFNKIP